MIAAQHPRKLRRDTVSGAAERAPPYLSEDDVWLFQQGRHYRLYEKLGAHTCVRDGVSGTWFAVWAPNANRVSVIGSFNRWAPDRSLLSRRDDSSGIWEGFVAGAAHGDS